ncbi:hypothetical protein FTM57_01220 [Chlamydia trachomatis]|uniref:Uncharacterized protein n=1 Tax=Chlamydia muridarum TaxID=83560 RepID=A0A0C5WV42_CHLMR|nr:hypothetical protein BB17_01145 [Chlamydia muridarum str. Nigg 2 MCR]AJR10304.1 hypothetical protein BD36_01155 [Chlamydia muridarum]AVM87997.1 hypothetical protein C6H96_01115 [Chlamydia muridarum str. Nigg]UFV51943.1 hypothetical protein FTN20_01225 [Chlamydia trachomatis]AVM88883.1 hypothetical protein C6H95_01115 [Chlamydia muridarum str. Nigg]
MKNSTNLRRKNSFREQTFKRDALYKKSLFFVIFFLQKEAPYFSTYFTCLKKTRNNHNHLQVFCVVPKTCFV